MLLIVGHGPSVNSGLGTVIDQHTVVRLKNGQLGKAVNWGTRTDYLCARSSLYAKRGIPFWHFPDEGWSTKWLSYFYDFKPKVTMKPWTPKPSTGLCAIFCAMEFLKPKELALIGFDRLFRPDEPTFKWHDKPALNFWPHDAHTERKAVEGLGIRIIDLAKEHGPAS